MKKIFIAALLPMLFIQTMLCTAEDTLTLNAYFINEKLIIEGAGCNSATQRVALKITAPGGEIININQIKAENDGTYKYFTTVDETADSGMYEVSVAERGTEKVCVKDTPYISEALKEYIEITVNDAQSDAIIKQMLSEKAEILELKQLDETQFENDAIILLEQKPSDGYKYENIIAMIEKQQKLFEELKFKDWTDADEFFRENRDILFHNIAEFDKYILLNETERNKICAEILDDGMPEALKILREKFVIKYNDSIKPKKTVNTAGGGGGGGSGKVSDSIIIASSKPQDSSEAKVPAEVPFSDLIGYEWAEDKITELFRKNIISPSDDKRFRPADNITREEFIKLIVGALEIPVNGRKSSFTDSDNKAWYYPYISAAYTEGLINGYTDGSFGIGKYISREEMAAILWRGIKQCELEITPQTSEISFSDRGQISEYALDAVKELSRRGIINGDTSGSFRPNDRAIRAEAAKLIADIAARKK